MWSLECKHQMLTHDGRRTTHDDGRRTTTDHNSSGELKTEIEIQNVHTMFIVEIRTRLQCDVVKLE